MFAALTPAGHLASRLLHSRVCLRQTSENGDDRDRTDDPLLAKQVLSQLSYAPAGTINPSNRGGPGRTRTSDPTLIKRVL